MPVAGPPPLRRPRPLRGPLSAAGLAAAAALATAGQAVAGPTYVLGETRSGSSADHVWAAYEGPRQPGEVLFARYTDVYDPNPIGQAARVWFDNNQGPNTRIVGADWQESDRYGDWQGLAYEEVISPDGQRTQAHAVIVGPERYEEYGDGIYVKLGSVAFEDLQGPAVGGVQVDGPQVGGWYTGPVRVSWDASDNAALRGTTGAQVDGGGGEDYGDVPDDLRKVSNPLDPGPDGAKLLYAYRTGQGWATATAGTTINVDRTPPSAPLLAPASPDTTAPRTIIASGSGDGAGSGVASYEYTKDAARTVTPALALAEPGQYTVQARAVDKVGLRSAWSAPVSVTVTPKAESQRPAPGTGEGGPGRPGSGGQEGGEAPQRVPLPNLSSVRLAHFKVSNGRNRLVGPCRGPERLCPRHLVALVTTVYGRRLSAVGRYAHRNRRGLSGAFVLLRGPAGRPVTSTFTDRGGRFVLNFRARQAGTYRVAAIGQPEVGTELVVRVRPRVTLKGAPGGRFELRTPFMLLRGQVGPARWGRERPVALEYLDGTWKPGQRPRGTWRFRAQTVTDRRGRFALPYRWKARDFAVLVRVVVPGDRGRATLRGWSPRVAVYVP